MFHYDTFYSVCRDRGFQNKRQIVEDLSKILGKEPSTVYNYMKDNWNLSLEEAARVAQYLEMTPKEFCDTFLHGLFEETPSGSYRCVPLSGTKLTRKQKKEEDRKKTTQEILEYFYAVHD